MDKDNVLWFYISMDYLKAMKIVDRFKQISDNKACALLRKSLAIHNNVKKLTITAQFHQSIEISFIIEKSKTFNDIRMIQIHLNFQLS